MIVAVVVDTSTVGQFRPLFDVDNGFVRDTGNVPLGITFTGAIPPGTTLIDGSGGPFVPQVKLLYEGVVIATSPEITCVRIPHEPV